MLLLIPVAAMLDRGQWWAAAFILATPVLLVDVVPVWVYPAAFWGCLLAVVVTIRDAPATARRRGAGLEPVRV
jgi:hypothetical protein